MSTSEHAFGADDAPVSRSCSLFRFSVWVSSTKRYWVILAKHRSVRKVELGAIEDEEQGRSRLEGAMQQVERTERVLKLFWRERHLEDRAWQKEFRRLDAQSEQVRAAAMIIFEQILA